MKVLVVGASGATGGHVVDQLLSQGIEVNAIVRSFDRCVA
ncbi:NAD(P)H-binding protein [Candidatus Reidiella endopervernicosa]|nr:NAD(P)H-binding protein [Candidatus Reidiella endopervernicosa]